ncbi:MAG TPA: hypothetical protein VD833_20220 [Vicinamibacterales bacterium]|nr:hypothetical protein [Vicinamibacterales bacterium]
MDSLSSDFEELLRCFNARSVNAVVVGGHALAFHGRPRYTKDLDVFVEPSAANAERLLLALADFGFGNVGLTVEDFATPGKIVQLGVAPNRVDLMTVIDGVTFAEAWAGRVAGHFGSQPVFFLGLAEFLRNKRAAGRLQDLADIDGLS